jgi:2-C-methyl-D-erythritol 4-phosphate cytidylyltransferase
MTKHHVIIVAGGSGQRMQTSIPKQFLLLDGLPVLMHTINRFHKTLPDASIVLVLPSEHLAYWNELLAQFNFDVPHQIAKGGETRFHSVKNGLALVNSGLVGIHDAVRPLVSSSTILRTFEAAKIHGAAVPVLQPSESMRILNTDGTNGELIRDALRTVQTPQCFQAEKIIEAYKQEFRPDFTDDASVAEYADFKITLVEGNEENIKITRPIDLNVAEMFLKNIR